MAKQISLGYKVPDYSISVSEPMSEKDRPTKTEFPTFSVNDTKELSDLRSGEEIEVKVKLRVVSTEEHTDEGSYRGKAGNRIEMKVLSMELPDKKPKSAMESIRSKL